MAEKYNSKNKKICFILPSHWSGSNGGAEQQAKLLLQALIKQNIFDLTYIARNSDEKYVPQGYRILIIKPWRISRYIGNIIDGFQLVSHLKEVRPQVIYQRVGCSYTGIAAYYAKRNNCKMIWHISSDANLAPLSMDKNHIITSIIQYLEKKILEYGIRNSGVIIAQTEHQANLLYKYYGRWPTLIIQNFHPIPKIYKKKGNIIKIIWVSNIKRLKRPEIFIKLARELSSYHNIKFIMIGRSGNTSWQRNIINEIRNTPKIEYKGEISHNDVNEEISNADIMVNTSQYEGFPNTFIQAWMREVPVISMDVNPDNILEKNHIGFYAKNYLKMKEYIEILINDKKLRKEMGHQAREFAVKNYSIDNISMIMKEIEN